MDNDLATTHKKLRALRERQDLKLKGTPLLRETFTSPSGEEIALRLRYYQVQMVFHLLAMRNFVVGDDTGLGKCVTKDTLVETDRGLVPIGSLQPTPDMMPDTFAPVDGWNVRIGEDLAPIKSFYYSGYKPTRRVRTRYGFEVEGSLVHPLYVRGRDGEDWRQTREIGIGDYLCVDRGGTFPSEEPTLLVPVVGGQVAANAQAYPVPNRMNPALARLLGYIVGEGWVNNRYTFQVSQSKAVNPEVQRDIRGLMSEVFGREVADADHMLVHSVFLRSYLEYMGVDYTTSRDKRVPDPILRATKESTCEFLRGLFEGEGSAILGGVEFSTSSEQLGREIQILLLRFGIVANRSPKTVEGFDHTYWRLTVFGDDARRFQREIGFVSARKQERLAGLIPDDSNPNHDVIPHCRDAIEELRRALAAKCKALDWNISQRWGSAFYNTLGHIRHGRRNPTYRFLGDLLDICREADGQVTSALTLGVSFEEPQTSIRRLKAFRQIEDIVSRRFFYDPVVEVVEGFKEVVDIEVDDPRHCFVGNGLVNHNTLETIASLCYYWGMYPQKKAVVLAKKAAVVQWAREFERFTDGVTVIVAKGSAGERKKAYAQFEASTGPTVLISGYRSMVRDIQSVQEWEDFVFVTDEATVYKNPGTQVHQLCKHLGSRADRVWALTATFIKNNLMEGYGIMQVVVPGLFRHTKTSFMSDYGIVRMQQVKGGRQIPVLVGYKPEDIERFKNKIDPYYLGRPKHEVASELPVLTMRNVEVGMTELQRKLYRDALEGLLEKGTGEEKETDKLTALIYCQQIVNHPCLLEYENVESEKMDALVDMITDGGEFEGEKIVIYTRFRKLVDFAIPYLEKKGVKCVRVTGAEDEDQRQDAMDTFTDPKSGVDVIWITDAGGDSINLQAGKAIVFFDSPWSAGDYLQILGRIIRIGSKHDRVYALHLVGKGTIDDRVQQVRNKKLKLIEAILGQRIRGEREAPTVFEVESPTRELYDFLVEDARGKTKGKGKA